MCGIAGFLTSAPFGAESAQAIGLAMAQRIAHRGPDGDGVWTDADGAVVLAHRRLAIVDLSAAGRQPMRSSSGRYELVYNGEIYNHVHLRAELPPLAWRGHSDTETLLAGIEHWGLERTLRKTVGMFAIALWDRQLRRLSLARDRIGEKPLYYGRVGPALLFASELKAFRAFPRFAPEIDRGAVALLLRHGYIPAPHSIYCGIRKLPPATFVHFARPDEDAQVQSFWSLREAVERGQSNQFDGADSEVVDAVEECLSTSIALQRIADVPLGAFLSGGIDSSTVVALMQKQSSQRVRTFSIGFAVPGYDEAGHARRVAQHLGTDHTELYVSGQQALDLVPELPAIYCEPFADSAQLPNVLIARLARPHVTVALSGDAGDELYGGYSRYAAIGSSWSRISSVPRPLRRAAGSGLGALAALVSGVRPEFLESNSTGGSAALLRERALRLGAHLRCGSPEQFYWLASSITADVARLMPNAEEPATALTTKELWPSGQTFDDRMMFLDQSSYLPDSILAKVDRSAMSASLETRVPMLDHRLLEQAWRLPMRFKRRDGVTKWVLREILYRHVPRPLVDRPKAGFSVPLKTWLAGPLRGWAEQLLDPTAMRADGWFDTREVRRMWCEQLSGRRDRTGQLWNLLMFQAWLAEQRKPVARSAAVVGVDAHVVV